MSEKLVECNLCHGEGIYRFWNEEKILASETCSRCKGTGKSKPYGIEAWVQDHQMVTIKKDGKREIGTDEEAVQWILEHSNTRIAADCILAGIPIVMPDESKVIFEEKVGKKMLDN